MPTQTYTEKKKYKVHLKSYVRILKIKSRQKTVLLFVDQTKYDCVWNSSCWFELNSQSFENVNTIGISLIELNITIIKGLGYVPIHKYRWKLKVTSVSLRCIAIFLKVFLKIQTFQVQNWFDPSESILFKLRFMLTVTMSVCVDIHLNFHTFKQIIV